MKIQCWSVGKVHEKYVQAGVEEFTKRIGNYFPVSWQLIAPSKHSGSMSAAEMKTYEAQKILELLKPEDYLILLDEKGVSMSSIALSAFIAARANESVKSLVFLIGGAFGVDNSIVSRAKTSWSLSALTFPHQLVRLILAEQIYRACSILRNEKYHHS